jgi:hypothetical protein
MAVSVLCALDKKGKDVYFDEETLEYDLIGGLARKAIVSTLTIRTENWGYFQVAFSAVLADGNSPWKDYDCFLAILGTAGVVGVLWIVFSCIQIHAYRRSRWESAFKVRPAPLKCSVVWVS